MNVSLGKVLITNLVFILIGSQACLANNDIDSGVHMYQAGHLDEAKQYFQSKIASSPKDAHAHYMLANVFVGLKQYANAKESMSFQKHWMAKE